MLEHRIILLFLVIEVILAPFAASKASTWRLEDNQNWDLVATDEQAKFLTEIADVQKIVDEGKTKAASKKFDEIKKNYTNFSGPDLTLFVKAELLLSKNKLTKAARSYDKLLTKYSDSRLKALAVTREYEIGMTYLGGRKKIVLGLIPIAGDEEGISILEKMIDHAGYNKQISIDASIAIAKNYEKREKFNEAYLKWYEIYSLGKKDADTERDALLGMAKNELAIYDDNPKAKRANFDVSPLRTARTYYEMLKSNYPDFAEENNVDETLNVITEQLAQKELNAGLFYQKMGNIVSANLYFNMVISNWPETKSAEIASNMLNKNNGS